MTQRVQSPVLFKKHIEFNTAVKERAVEESFRDLVANRAAQFNGCGFRPDMLSWRSSCA